MFRLFILLSVLIAGCAPTSQFQAYPGDLANKDSATIHVVRENSMFGAMITAPVYVDKFLLGRIGPGGYLKTSIPTGRVHLTSTTADVIIDAKKGAEYFFEVSMPMQMWFYAPDFDIAAIDRERAKQFRSEIGH
jgi:hypothetical protein